MLGKVGGIFKSGCDRQCTFSIGNCFPNDIIIFLNLMPQEVVARHPRASECAKINEALYGWYVLATSPMVHN